MKPKINFSERTAIESCPSAHEAPPAFRHGVACHGAVRQVSSQSGKFYRDPFYRGKFYRGRSPEFTGANCADSTNSVKPCTTRRSSSTKDFCPGSTGQFDSPLKLRGASSSDFLE
jgi:hypothetical protein